MRVVIGVADQSVAGCLQFFNRTLLYISALDVVTMTHRLKLYQLRPRLWRLPAMLNQRANDLCVVTLGVNQQNLASFKATRIYKPSPRPYVCCLRLNFQMHIELLHQLLAKCW